MVKKSSKLMEHTGRYARLTLLGLVCSIFLATFLVQAAPAGIPDAPAWAAPNAKTIRRLGMATDQPNQPTFQGNLDCSELTYHRSNSSTMEAGCFMTTAYGLVDLDNDLVIFNDTDEAVPLLSYSPGEVLTPWPGTLDTLALETTVTGGSSVSLYTNITARLQTNRDLLGRVASKQVTSAPDIGIRDASGQPLVVNVASMAFSDNGSWLVAENLSGSFVRINLATLDQTAFAPAFGALGSPALLRSQVAVSHSGRYVAIGNEAADSFRVYDLSNCSTSVVPRTCTSYEYRAFVASQVSGMSSISHIRFVNEGLLSFNASYSGGTDSFELAPADSISSLIDYLALGDSYTSGEGAFDYREGTDTGDNLCHLSSRAYPLLLRHDLFNNAGGYSVACSGAKTGDVTPGQPESYSGQARDGVARSKRSSDSTMRLLADFTPGYLAQIDFVSQYQPEVLTLSVGGDDIGFGDIVEQCVMPHISLHLSDSVCYDTYEDRLELKNLIDRSVARWTALYRKVQAASPSTRLYVIGYPQIASDTGNCALNVHLSKGELEFSEDIIDYLNAAIAKAATSAKANYVDISQALNGHRLCQAAGYNVAVNGLTAGNDGGILGLELFGRESYHPNMLGQSLMEAAILKQTHNFQLSVPASDSSPASTGQKLVNAPKTGRPLSARIPAQKVTSSLVKKSSRTSLSFSGSDNNLLPNSRYQVQLDGPSGIVIGSLTTDGSGTATGELTVPADTEPGGHTIDVTGPGEGNEPIDAVQPVYVASSDDDSDGDGIPNSADSCPLAIKSSIDADHDGVDDSCDPIIGQQAAPPASGSNGGDTTGTAVSTLSTARLDSHRIMVTRTHPQVLGAATNARRSSQPLDRLRTGPTRASEKAGKTTHRSLLRSWIRWLVLELLILVVLLILLGLLKELRRRVRGKRKRLMASA